EAEKIIREALTKITTLEDRMKSKIRVSCGKSVDKSVVSADGQTWYRARLDLQGVISVPDIEATITELLQDGKRVQLDEILVLTMYPGVLLPGYPIDKNLKTLSEGSPEFVDLICVQANGVAIFPLKFYPR